MPTVLGIDEAGRGPCIGPMVIAGVLVDWAGLTRLIELRVRDSKLLSPRRRSWLFDKIKTVAKNYRIISISPREIDAIITRPGMNLNWLEASKSAQIINALKPDQAIIDCPSPNTKAYRARIEGALKAKTALVVENKADFKYPVVAAASILAKVSRDLAIARLRRRYGNLGSGYPSDPVTKAFMAANWERYPELFRHSWACYARLAAARRV